MPQNTMSLGFIFFWNHIFSFRKIDLSLSCPDWRSWDSRPCLSPALCILYSSRRLRFPAPHIWHSGPGTELIWDSSDRWGLGWECYLVAPVVTLIADPDEGAGPHVGVTDHTLPIALLTQSTWGREILILILQPSSLLPPSSLRRSLPMATPACFRQNIKSGWCLAMSRRSE